MQRTNHVLEYKEGTLYPWLHRLEGNGEIASQWAVSDSGRKRKYYTLTRKGATRLKKASEEWATFSKAVNVLLHCPA